MLFRLKIANFALVDSLQLDFDQGLNVLTGETGAGKSIILDAIDLVLGGKANARMIRQGSDRATIEAYFRLDHEINHKVSGWLQEQSIKQNSENLVLSRELSLGKSNRVRSRCTINGNSANKQQLEQLRWQLLEITAQGQTSELLVPEKQRSFLDAYGGELIAKKKSQVAKAYTQCQSAQQKLLARRQAQEETKQKQELLEFQLRELSEAELTNPEELIQLEQERDRLSHVVELQQLSYQVYQLLYQSDHDEATANDLLGDAERNLEEMTKYDREIQPLLEMVQSAIAQVVEAGQQINSYGDALEADPETLAEIEARIQALKSICRKYNGDLAEVIAFYHQVKQDLAELTDGGQSLDKLQADYEAAQAKLVKVCAELTRLRSTAVGMLEQQLVKQLQPLAMDKVIFECQLQSIEPTAQGADKVVFYFSPNPGEAVQPLADTASGGEMSRFLLALKACFSATTQVTNTLVFDEIDAGVSGKVAQAIAEKLHQLSQQNQILCVTHQPLIAAMADAHYKVEKTIVKTEITAKGKQKGEQDIRTVVRVQDISERDLRIQELAQITGGHSADQALEFAQSLLVKAADYRKQQQ